METSSAKRLADILKKILDLTDNLTSFEVWRNVFEIPKGPENDEKVLLMFIELRKLIKKTKSDILSLDINHDLYLSRFRNIEEIGKMPMLYQTNRSRLHEILDPLTMQSLDFCVDAMSKRPAEKGIEEDELLAIKAEVDKLMNDVLEKEIEPTIKKVIISLLESINMAIIKYKISGIESFEKAFENIIGKLCYNQRLFDNQEGKEKLKKLSKLIKKITEFITMAKGLKELAEPLINILP